MNDFKNFMENGLSVNYKNLIVVDIQPEYESDIGFNISDFVKFLLETIKQNKSVLYLYNGPSLGMADDGKIIEWLVYEKLKIRASQSKLQEICEMLADDITWIDKSYNFFRDWMDYGISDESIIKVLKYMKQNNINDSREIDEKTVESITGGDYPEPLRSHTLYFPDVSERVLQRYPDPYICGGGETECLREVEILMEVFDLKYTQLRKFMF